MLIKNSSLAKKIKIVYLAVLILGLLVLASLAVLGNSERTGYISEFAPFNAVEINDNIIDKDLTSNTYEYRMRIKYNSKVFRNSDIFRVYPQSIELPDYIENIKWDGKGSPFGKLTSSKELASDYVIDIGYKLKLRYGIILYFVLFMVLMPLIITPKTRNIIIGIIKQIKNISIRIVKQIKNISIRIVTQIKNISIRIVTQIKNISIRIFFYDGVKILKDNNGVFNKQIQFRYIMLLIYPVFIVAKMILIQAFPYHQSGDPTFTYALDSLIINGGGMPEHLLHPDMGVLWIEKFLIFPIAKLLGIVSISTLQELQSSLNPYLSFADVMTFLIPLRTLYIYIASILIYVALIKFFDEIIENAHIIIRFFIVFAVSVVSFYPVIAYDYVTIRYEFGGFLWCSLALLVAVYTLKTQQKRYIVLLGVLSGWAFISKIVLLPTIFTIYGFYFISTVSTDIENNFQYNSKIQKRYTILSITYLLVVIGLVGMIIYLFKTEKIYITWVFNWVLSIVDGNIVTRRTVKYASAFIIFLFMQAGFAVFIQKFKNVHKTVVFYFNRTLLFTSSFFIPMLIIIFQSNGIYIFSYTYLFSFALGSSVFTGAYGNDTDSLRIGLIIFALSIFFIIYKRNIRRLHPLILSFSLLGIIMMANSFLRPGGGGYAEVVFIVTNTSICISLLFYHTWRNSKALIRFIALIFISLLLFIPIKYCVEGFVYKKPTSQRLFGASNLHDNTITSWHGYTGNASLKEVYPTESDFYKVFYWSKKVRELKGLLNAVQGTKNISLEDTAMAISNYTLSKDGEKLKKISNELEGGIIIPLDDLKFEIHPNPIYDFYLVSLEKYDVYKNLKITDMVFETSNSDKLNVYYCWTPAKEDGHNYFYNIERNKNNKMYLVIVDKLAKAL